jgi:hypothetical protein
MAGHFSPIDAASPAHSDARATRPAVAIAAAVRCRGSIETDAKLPRYRRQSGIRRPEADVRIQGRRKEVSINPADAPAVQPTLAHELDDFPVTHGRHAGPTVMMMAAGMCDPALRRTKQSYRKQSTVLLNSHGKS